MKPLKIGVIGLGGRGTWLTRLLADMSADNSFPHLISVAALCDLEEKKAQEAADAVNEKTGASPLIFTNENDFLNPDILDAVIIATSWQTHIPLAIKAMKTGIRPGIECGGAASLAQCHDLVKTFEKTGIPCMFLENCNYGREEMALSVMCEKGVFGELIHLRCGYQHDLREYLTNCVDTGNFRLTHHLHKNADTYPMHGLGPMMKLLKINRGNRFVSLVSMSSKARGLNEYAREKYPAGHPLINKTVTQGDIVTTMLKCENGETLLLTHDTTLPRPYSRSGMVQGTKGIWMEDNRSICIEGMSPRDEWEDFYEFIEKNGYEHPVWDEYQKSGVKEGHGGMDYLVVKEFIKCSAEKSNPPIDTYDAAVLTSITPLSEKSIILGSQPVEVPDFTNGSYMRGIK